MWLVGTMKTTALAIFLATLALACSAQLAVQVTNDSGDLADSDTQLEVHQQNSGSSGSHSFKDVIAQASCSAYMPVKQGWVYAVRRACSGTQSCADICNSGLLQGQDKQTVSKPWKCIGTVHVYQRRPPTGDGKSPTLGLKTRFYGYKNCNSAGRCGPNYCCCEVTKQ